MIDRIKTPGFSLLEIVIVVAIIAILAAIAIPRLGRGSECAAESALEKNLAILRKAIDHYAAEHLGGYPHAVAINAQLTRYTNEQGQVRVNMDSTHIYGPYLRSVPPLPVGIRQGNTKIDTADAEDVGWVYRRSDGHIRANTGPAERGEAGISYRDY